MHLLIVTFNLKDLSDTDYRRGCEEEASAFAGVPGLISKVWLADERTNTYGGVYTFVDRAATEAYTRSDLFKSMIADSTLVNLTASDFEILEEPTRVTRGASAVGA